MDRWLLSRSIQAQTKSQRLTKIRLKRAFSLGGKGCDEGIFADFRRTDYEEVNWWSVLDRRPPEQLVMLASGQRADSLESAWIASIPFTLLFGLVFGNSKDFLSNSSCIGFKKPHICTEEYDKQKLLCAVFRFSWKSQYI